MGKDTAIGWCDATFNPWWGCTRVSPGCERCYAESFANRIGQDIWGPTTPRRFFGENHWNEPLRWDAKARADGVRRRVFCASMADICEDRDDLRYWRDRLIQVVQHTRHLDWLFLTKRPENYVPLFGAGFFQANPHVWPGFTAENQEQLEKRVAHVLALPGRGTKWISAEPLLSSIDFEPSGALWPLCRSTKEDHDGGMWCDEPSIEWVVVGLESGDGYRDVGIEPLVSIVEQCRAAQVACYVKQDAGRFPGQRGRIPDEYWQVKEFPR